MEDLHRQAFREEAADILDELETALLELESNPTDSELVNRVFRAMHTLKGSGAMFGFDDIARFTHDVETVFDQVRSGQLDVTKHLLDLTLAAQDLVKDFLRYEGQDNPELIERECELRDSFRSLAPPKEAPSPKASITEPQIPAAPPEKNVYRVRFSPSANIFKSGNNPEYLLEDLRALGQCLVFAFLDDVPALNELDPLECRMHWEVLLTTDVDQQAIHDVFVFVEDECLVSIQAVEGDEFPEHKRLGEILVDRGDVSVEGVSQALKGQKRLGALLAESGLVPEKCVESALAEQALMRDRKQHVKTADAASSLRVSSEKLDLLQDLVGELVIVQSQIKMATLNIHNPLLLSLAEELERLSDDLRTSTLSIRMLPIGSTFGTYRRLVRDLSSDLGKTVELVTSGEETELDKTVLERLGEALMHLIRNSIDHGIEPPEARQAAGKPGKAVVSLEAEHSGGDVVIRVRDDGRGIDAAKVRQKALERGLITPDAQLSERETLELIFEPGFSTAKEVTNVSGRGVGMDVVKRVMHAIRGTVGIQSFPGQGTEVTVRLPLTLAIIEGLQVQVAGQSYVLPLDCVEECVELRREDIDPEGRNRILNLRGEIVPYIHLRNVFHLPGESPDIEQVVILRVEGKRVGMVVDHVVGEHQTVIKSLGPVFRGLDGFSGATVQGDGTMSLILDVKRLVWLDLQERQH
ncbi:chemotaxis protein CheA [Fundidesulfovibrio butyratiphilus]